MIVNFVETVKDGWIFRGKNGFLKISCDWFRSKMMAPSDVVGTRILSWEIEDSYVKLNTSRGAIFCVFWGAESVAVERG